MTILIVDDFHVNRTLLNAILTDDGFEVIEAADGAAALRILESQPVDFVISDILMPNMDGYRLCTEVRHQSRLDHVPFLFHTSTYTSPSDEALALKLGADGFMRKPVPARTIIENVHGLLRAPRPGRKPVQPPDDLDLTAEYTQRLVAKLEEKNEELFAATQESRKTSDALENAMADLETLSRRLLATGEAELRRIARELHDEIGQGLTAAKLEIEAAKRISDPVALSLRLDDAVAVIDHLLESVRTLSLDLRPASLDELGLVAALRAHAYSHAARAGLTMHFEADELPRSRDAAVEIACFRIAQEALTNIIRHAKAKSVELQLRRHEAEVRLVVQDDGAGFDTAVANAGREGAANLGLLGMRERAQLSGGRFFCTSAAGRGTRIEAHLPW